ncbi:related to integral membrane protein pth11 [Fusarium proliferatum]|nr:related to integral membrane protein pth11 [Fusarium proliferatum]
MAMGGDGPWAIGVMWALTVVVFIFVVLRVYTRVVVVQSFGVDDHVFNLAFVLLVFYTSFTTTAAHYGFGQNMTDIIARNPDDLPVAILFEAIGQTFAVVGMAVAKWSLGLFLLRIVKETWHKIAIWISMAALAGASISTCFVFWLQCTPPKHLWDRRIPGKCTVDSTPVSMTLCILCVIVDFFFAGFPWLFIWALQMKKREKIVILCSLSLGVIAGACGIKRTLEVPELSSPNYTKSTVGLIVWSAAEIAVTMICIGIPVCRPLYKQYLDKWTSRDGSKYKEQSGGGSHPLQTIGGSYINANTNDTNLSSEGCKAAEYEKKIGIKGPFTKTRIYSKPTERVRSDDQSDESILGPDFRRNQHDDLGERGIRVTYEVTTTQQGI